ncbi:NnrS family protein [Benzoatithermus flavus]|uniref:NnrS family protein n=1 Tax=Benzoatithermus flavus TaxID=3108223 RepID=A0ABU8XT18_9PROT
MRPEVERLPPVLQHGFRPFFLLGAVWAVLALALWLSALAGVTLPTAMEPLAWHRHEMLFGYISAVIAAFLLTAVPNWTGGLPLRGKPLLWLVALWLAARLAVLAGARLGPWPGLVLDVGFLAVLAGVVAREIVAGKNWRNLPVVTLVSLLALADLLSHLEQVLTLPWDMLGDRLAIGAVAGLVALIGGRITPSFTTNWLKARKAQALPAPVSRLDNGVLILTALALLAWFFLPESAIAGLLLLAAAVGTAARLARWQGAATTSEPLLLILHVGYAWLALAFALFGLAAFGIVPRSAALHAMTAGAFGTMTLAVMTRATLGHTGRALTADRWTSVIFVLVNVGALARVLASLVPAAYTPALHLAGLAWGGAFLLYILHYGPMLLGPRHVAKTGGAPAPAR